jgi:hypothetical protein
MFTTNLGAKLTGPSTTLSLLLSVNLWRYCVLFVDAFPQQPPQVYWSLRTISLCSTQSLVIVRKHTLIGRFNVWCVPSQCLSPYERYQARPTPQIGSQDNSQLPAWKVGNSAMPLACRPSRPRAYKWSTSNNKHTGARGSRSGCLPRVTQCVRCFLESCRRSTNLLQLRTP